MFKALFKKQMQETWQVYTTGRKGQDKAKSHNKSQFWFIVLYVFCFISLAFAFFGMSSLFASTILGTGNDWIFFGIMGMMGLIMGVFGSVFTTSTALYKAKDNEFLISLPIPPMYILFTRMISVYIVGIIFEAVVLLPTLLQYCLFAASTSRLSVLAIVYNLINVFVMNALVVVISSVLGWVVAWISSKLKNNSFITVLISLCLIGGYYVFYFNIQNILNDIAGNVDAFEKGIKTYFYPLYLYGKSCTGDTISFILFIAVVALLLGLTCFILSKNFNKIISKSLETSTNTKKISTSELAKRSVNNGVSKALFKKEMKRFTSSANYMLNCGLGCVFSVGLSAFIFIRCNFIKSYVDTAVNSLGSDATSYLPIIVLAACILMGSFNIITAPAISLEGNRLWILRTAPVSAMDVFNAKIKVHEYITWPCLIIFCLALSMIFSLNWSTTIALIVAIYVFVVVDAKIGLYMNLKSPKLDWTNEVVPIKQSLPVAIMIFSGIPMAAILCGPYFIKGINIGAESYIIIVMAILVLISRLLDNWFRTKGTEIWNNL